MSAQTGSLENLDGGSVVSAENPWPGLLSFREADQRWFQGRRDETEELAQHIKRERLTVLFALSGIGKSSLLQAGLFPALRRDDIFPVYVRLDYLANNPDLTSQVFEAIAQAGAAADIAVPAAKGGETLWEYFHNVEVDFWTRQKRRVLPLLVFDQFEEIFTLGKSESQAVASAAFLESLADLAEGTVPASVTRRWASNPEEREKFVEEGEYKILISLREDFLAELSDQRRRIATVPQRRYRLRQMNGEGALLAVSQATDLVDETVSTQIVNYVAAGERVGGGRRGRHLKELDVEPALLSVVCRELNQRRKQKGERKISADLLEGEQEQVLNDFYDRSFEGIDPRVRAFVEEQLITIAGARNSVPHENAVAIPGVDDAAIEQLVERRLLRKEFRRNEVRLELTHDLLTGVVRSSRDMRRAAEERARNKEKEAANLAKLRRSRVLNSAFALITGVAVIAAIFGFVQKGQATASFYTAEARRKDANDALAKLKDQMRLTDEARKGEGTQRVIAEQKAKIAEIKQSEADAANSASQQSAAQAIAGKAEADKQRKNAEEQKKVAEVEKKNAEAKSKEAIDQAAVARAAELKEAEARKTLEAQNREKDIVLAANKVTESVDKSERGKPEEALDLLAEALKLDPQSGIAKTFAFDQLLRGAWQGRTVQPGTSGAEPFVHAPLAHSAAVQFAAFSPDGRLVATAGADHLVRLWNWQTRASLESLKGHTNLVRSVAFSPDGRWLVSASNDGTARLWDVSQQAEVRSLTHGSPVNSAVFSSDGTKIVTGSLDGNATIWNAVTGEPVGTPMKHAQAVKYAAFSPNGRLVATACADGVARLWSVSGAKILEIPVRGSVNSVAFSPDSRHVVTASDNGEAHIWDVASGSPLFDAMKHKSPVYSAVFNARGDRVATASFDRTARIWDAKTGRPLSGPLSHSSPIYSVAFSPDNRRIVTATTKGNTAQIWDVSYDFGGETPALVKVLNGVSKKDARELDEVKASVQAQSSSTFLRWFFEHRR